MIIYKTRFLFILLPTIFFLSCTSKKPGVNATQNNNVKRLSAHVEVPPPPEPIIFTVTWTSKNFTDVVFLNGIQTGYRLFSTRDKKCDFNNIQNCDAGQIHDVPPYPGTPEAVRETANTITTQGYYKLQNWDRKFNDNGALTPINGGSLYSPRSGHKVLYFQNKFWLIGGVAKDFDGNVSSINNDIWSSLNGLNWSQEVEQTPYPERMNFGAVVFQNKLWVIGGSEKNRHVYYNDIWSSSDGINWTKEVENAKFDQRAMFEVLVFKNKMWIIGGSDTDVTGGNEVWSSDDGITWEEKSILDYHNFPKRIFIRAIVFNNKMWVIGGLADGRDKTLNDLWTSEDGVKWQQGKVIGGQLFSARYLHSLTVFNNMLWVIGGSTDTFRNQEMNDVWVSKDGEKWDNINLNYDTAFSARGGHQAVVSINDKSLYLFGGYGDSKNKNDTFKAIINSKNIDFTTWGKGQEMNFPFTE